MSVTQEQVVDYIKNLKLGEVKALIETLESELGVSASAPVMAVAGGAAAGGGAQEPAQGLGVVRAHAVAVIDEDADIVHGH